MERIGGTALRFRGGGTAFGDGLAVDAAWEKPLEEFRGFLRARARATLLKRAA